jgi:hypothetical protein
MGVSAHLQWISGRQPVNDRCVAERKIPRPLNAVRLAHGDVTKYFFAIKNDLQY